jgi:hypothetical protein
MTPKQWLMQLWHGAAGALPAQVPCSRSRLGFCSYVFACCAGKGMVEQHHLPLAHADVALQPGGPLVCHFGALRSAVECPDRSRSC